MDDHINQYIKIPITLEQCILEGSYKSVLDVNNNHDKNYKYYLNKFESAIRFQIARSAEKSYESIRVSDAVSLLRFTNVDALVSFIKTDVDSNDVSLLLLIVKEREIDWKIHNDRLFFSHRNKDKVVIPSRAIIDDVMLLAHELEKII